jgi:hypothetical protein
VEVLRKVVAGISEETCEERKKIQEVYKETTAAEFVDFFKPNLQRFIKHNYVATWQDTQCSLTMETLPDGAILSHIDFAENYSFQAWLSRGRFQTDGRTDGRSDDGRGGVRDLDAL